MDTLVTLDQDPVQNYNTLELLYNAWTGTPYTKFSYRIAYAKLNMIILN